MGSRVRQTLFAVAALALLPGAALADAIDTRLAVRVTALDAGVDAVAVGDVFFLEFEVEDSSLDVNPGAGGSFPDLVTSFAMSAAAGNTGAWTPSGVFDLAASNFVTNANGDNITLQLRGMGFPDGGVGLPFFDIDLRLDWPFDLIDGGAGDSFAQQLLPHRFGVPPAVPAGGIRFTDGADFPTASFAPVPTEVTVPGDFATIQAAVDAVQNDANPGTVLLTSDGPFDESVDIDESVTLAAAAGATPVIERLAGFGPPIDIRSSAAAATAVVLRDLVLRVADPGPDETIRATNDSPTEALDIVLERVRAEVDVGDHGIRMATSDGGRGSLTVVDSSFEMIGDGSGGPSCIRVDPNGFELELTVLGSDFRASRATGIVIMPGVDAPVTATLHGNRFEGFVSPDGRIQEGITVVGPNTAGNISAHVTITNNLFVGTRAALFANGNASNALTVFFNNNTVVDAVEDEGEGAILAFTNNESSVDLHFANNIIAGGAGFAVLAAQSATSTVTLSNRNNLLFGNTLGDYAGLAAAGPGDVFADPLFVDAEGGDYRLQPPSPAVDAGDDAAPGGLGPGTDFAGMPRIQDGDDDGVARVDIGAFEVPQLEPVPALGPPGAALLGVVLSASSLSVLRRRARFREPPRRG